MRKPVLSRAMSALALVSSLALLAGWSATPWVSAAPPLQTKLRSLQSLTMKGDANWLRFLSIDEKSGKVKLDPKLNQTQSGGFWELRRDFYRNRAYNSYTIRNRGNSKFNGYYLAIESTTGELMLRRKESVFERTTSWMIRYAGKHNGFDSYYIQSQGRSKGEFDMAFLTVDDGGLLKVVSDPVSGSNWMMRRTPQLPTEVIH